MPILAIAQAQGDEYKTTYTIDILEDGSATWVIEDRIGLTTQSAEAAFKEYVSALESNQSELERKNRLFQIENEYFAKFIKRKRTHRKDNEGQEKPN